MKNLIFALLVAAVPFTLKAQDSSSTVPRTNVSSYSTTHTSLNNFIWSVGVEPSLPIGHFHTYSGFGLGGFVQGEYKTGTIGITFNLGYIDYSGKTTNGTNYPDFKYWPALAGLKYYMSGKTFLHGQAGAGFGSNGLGTNFWYGGGIGFGSSRSFGGELKYTGWKQNLISNNGTIYNNTTGTTNTTGNGGGYGGHYSTIDFAITYNF